MHATRNRLTATNDHPRTDNTAAARRLSLMVAAPSRAHDNPCNRCPDVNPNCYGCPADVLRNRSDIQPHVADPYSATLDTMNNRTADGAPLPIGETIPATMPDPDNFPADIDQALSIVDLELSRQRQRRTHATKTKARRGVVGGRRAEGGAFTADIAKRANATVERSECRRARLIDRKRRELIRHLETLARAMAADPLAHHYASAVAALADHIRAD